MKKETQNERKERKERAKHQLALIGRVTITNLHSPEVIETAMYMSGGNVRVLSSLLKVGIPEVMRYITNHSEVAKLWQEIRRSQLAKAEDAIESLLDSKNEDMRFRAAKYLLDNRGSELGYGNQNGVGLQVDVNKDGNVSVKSIFGIPE